MKLSVQTLSHVMLVSLSVMAPLSLGATKQASPLKPMALNQVVTPECNQTCLALDTKIWGTGTQRRDKSALLSSIDHSLRYLKTKAAREAYQDYGVSGISLGRVERSLRRFRQLLLQSQSPQALQKAVQREFTFYQSTGKDGQGTVGFTGYFQPIHQASRVRTSEFRYPLYKRPPQFETWSEPHPTREQLEGRDGLQAHKGALKGLELFWLRDRLEAFLVQVQGSAVLQFTDKTVTGVGYAGKTKHDYTSIGKELIKDGKLPAEGITLQKVIHYFEQHPQDLNVYLPRNQSFVFFTNTGNAPPKGSLKVPVTAERSIATDKSVMPPGALALIQTQIPMRGNPQAPNYQWVNRFVLDQDTGSAIKGPGRVDIFMGTGKQAGERAGLVNHPGRLYYLLLKQP